ncbi:prepilin peptidase [Chloroflexota bacterium]
MLLLIIAFAILGSAVGSFLNVCIDRLPRGQSITTPPSHCSACNHKLSILDLIPLFSYLWLRGRCRYCQAHIPLRIPVVEGISALLFALLYWKFGLGLELVISLIYACLLTVIFVIDLEHQLVLDKIIYPSMVLALAFSFFWPGLGVISALGEGSLGKVISSLTGGALGLVAMALPFVISRGGMGMGDVKLAALIGLMTGFPLIIVALLISWISGGLVAAILLALKIKKRKDTIPSATFMAIATMVTLLWGQEIWRFLY